MPEITVEHPAVMQAMKEYMRQVGEFAPWRQPALTEEEIRNWRLLLRQQLSDRLCELGYFKSPQLGVVMETPDAPTVFDEWTIEYESDKLSPEEFMSRCRTQWRSHGFDIIARGHQMEFGLPVVGYVPSERLVKGREALARYHEGHANLSAKGWYPEIYEDQDALLEQLKRDVLEAGFFSLEEFHEINGELP